VTRQHASVSARPTKRFILAAEDAYVVGASNPVDLGEFSEPEPRFGIIAAVQQVGLPVNPRALSRLLGDTSSGPSSHRTSNCLQGHDPLKRAIWIG
jgi:hypothetical protein